MTLLQFEYVLAVIEHGSFTRAAEACFVTQPTLSAQIAKLEQELGMSLLDRVRHPAGPAPGAEEILSRAKSAIQLFQSIPALADEQRDSITGELRVGIIPTLAQYLLPLFLESFLKDFPSLHLKISELQSEEILKQIRDFALDCGVLALPTKEYGLSERPLFLEEFFAYLPPGNSGTGRIDVSSLKREGLLLLNEGHCFRDQVVELCGPAQNYKPARIAFETGSLESLKKLVDQGIGHTLLPELSILDMDGERRSRVHPLGPVAPLRSVGLVYHPAYSRPKLIDLFSSAIKDGLPHPIKNRKSEVFLPWRN